MMPSSLKKHMHTHDDTTTEQNKISCVLATQHTKKQLQQQHKDERLCISRPSGRCHLVVDNESSDNNSGDEDDSRPLMPYFSVQSKT